MDWSDIKLKVEDRAVLLSALGCVDEVVIFTEDTPAELLSVLRPDILVKGGDYKAEEVVGREYVKRVENNTITDVLSFHKVKSGDVFFLPAGRIHAIGKGIFIAEIQQSSNITYRIYDYNRKDKNGNTRELHTELAKDAIDYKLYDDLLTTYTPASDKEVKLAECQYFVTNLLDVTSSVECEIAKRDSFVIYICMGGEATVTDSEGGVTPIKQGETILVPASTEKVTITGKAKLLECYIPR